MYPKQLGINEKSYFSTKNTFGSSAKTAKGFVEHNYSILMHAQEFYEINIILKGEGMHYIGEGKLSVGAGDVFIIPPEFMHGYVGSEGFDVYHVLLSPRFFEKYSGDLQMLPAFSSLFKVEPEMRKRFSSNLHLKLTSKEINELLPLLDALMACPAVGSEGLIECTGYAFIIIGKLCAKFGERLALDVGKDSSGSDEAFMKSIAYIYERYSEKITIEELSKIARMSRSAYLTRFKAFTGTSPGEFIQRHRVENAANMLICTSHTVSEIAASSGFYDPPHMIRCFEKHMGMSPTEYRRQRERS